LFVFDSEVRQRVRINHPPSRQPLIPSLPLAHLLDRSPRPTPSLYPYTHKLINNRGSHAGRPASPSTARISPLYPLKSSFPPNSQIARAGCSSPINRSTSTTRQNNCSRSITS